MDKYTSAKKDSSELARELLIAISDSVPDKSENSASLYGNPTKRNGFTVNEEDIADKLRSDLISISNLPSPDKIALPAQEG